MRAGHEVRFSFGNDGRGIRCWLIWPGPFCWRATTGTKSRLLWYLLAAFWTGVHRLWRGSCCLNAGPALAAESNPFNQGCTTPGARSAHRPWLAHDLHRLRTALGIILHIKRTPDATLGASPCPLGDSFDRSHRCLLMANLLDLSLLSSDLLPERIDLLARLYELCL